MSILWTRQERGRGELWLALSAREKQSSTEPHTVRKLKFRNAPRLGSDSSILLLVALTENRTPSQDPHLVCVIRWKQCCGNNPLVILGLSCAIVCLGLLDLTWDTPIDIPWKKIPNFFLISRKVKSDLFGTVLEMFLSCGTGDIDYRLQFLYSTDYDVSNCSLICWIQFHGCCRFTSLVSLYF